ncbi:MAG: formamidopyrimidine-DNA glycosylase, partial [Oscillochloris sp.]|nr:formamidopyrimidine-DNA glycosylase [Oscillochloris sp.]
MAELPEVEILAADMRELVVGRRILGAAVWQPAAVRFPAPELFVEQLIERRILGAQRRAKYLLCPLEGDQLLTFHMMLHGTLDLVPADTAPDPITMLTLALEGAEDLQLRDRKGFARVALGEPVDLTKRLKIDTLGPELLDPAFTPAALQAILARRRGVLKPILVNQQIVAGLGNRDVDESLWEAQINPHRAANSLEPAEIERLLAQARDVLHEGLALRGTMTDLRGVRGKARQRRKIYGHDGE